MTAKKDQPTSSEGPDREPPVWSAVASDLISESELLLGLAAAFDGGLPVSDAPLRGIPKHGDVIAGRYRLIEVIGEGGMSTVWYAEQLVPVKRKVALKLIKPGMDSKTVIARFEAERQALAMMDHPNIAQVLDGGVTDWGHPFFVMELIRGTSITKFCDERKLSVTERLEMLIPVCQAIQHAHQKGIIHRDIKPSNILVALFDGVAIPKVIDFGVAKAIGGVLDEFSVHTSFGAVVGTPEYMSPEQAVLNNWDVDTRTDVYSLGVLSYELVTGSTPFNRTELMERGLQEILKVIREQDPPKPSVKLSTSKIRATIAESRGMDFKTLSHELHGDLDWILMKALEKDRIRRYVSADAMARDLQRYLRNEPVDAREPSFWYVSKKLCLRYRWQVAAMASICAAILLGSIGTAIGLVRSERLRRQVEQTQKQTELLATSEREAKLAAIIQKELAEKAEDQTLESYRASTNDAVEKLIGSKTSFTEIERDYLNGALKRWLEFAERTGSDERTARIRAEAFERVSLLHQSLGDMSKAVAERKQAVSEWLRLVELCPTMPDYRHELSHSRRNLAILLQSQGSAEQANEVFDLAFSEQHKVVDQYPEVAAYQQEFALQLGHRARMEWRLGHQEESLSLYDQALTIHRRFAGQSPELANYQYMLAACLRNYGDQLSSMDEPKAEPMTREALQIFTKLSENEPLATDYQIGLSASESTLCNILTRQNRLEESLQIYRYKVERLAKTVQRFPSVMELRKQLVRAHQRYSVFLRDKLARSQEALEQIKQSVAIAQQLAESHPEVDLRSLLAEVQHALGYLLDINGNYEDGKHALLVCIQLRRELQSAEPTSVDRKLDLAYAIITLGDLASRARKYQEAVDWYNEGIDTAEPYYNQKLKSPLLREELIIAYRHRAHAIEKLAGDPKDDWDKALKLLPTDDSNATKIVRAKILVESHQPQAALKLLDQLLPFSDASTPGMAHERDSWRPVDCFDIACMFTQLSVDLADQSDVLLGRAMDAFRLAVEKGYVDAAFVRSHSVLDPLRSRSDFQELVSKMQEQSSRQ